ncbi:tRNA lysidine(34) synthetase TilS [Campylobacter sp. faydin G-105]|nr:tRNA lysidine(34) synthetase TilS [Campylobacter anatolicus]
MCENLCKWLSSSVLKRLRDGKNLLAFSHGIDSTALFYILNELGIGFDIAMVDYHHREQSKAENNAATELALKYKKQIYRLNVKLSQSNFESNARAVRYEFFDKICIQNGYTNLLLAHQLDDRLEWFLMQLGRGAGLSEMLGMSEIENRERYAIVRPLLSHTKSKLKAFLDERKVEYFIDESNFEYKYTRNFIRHKFSQEFLREFGDGVVKSFEFLDIDNEVLKPSIVNLQEQFYMVLNNANAVRGVDKVCKMLGVLMSEAQRKECLNSGVISGKIAVGMSDEFIFITPYLKTVMDKKFKEKCRVLSVPKHNRAYLYEIKFDLNRLNKFKSTFL